MSARRQNILLSVLGLATGGLLYLLFRETSYVGQFFGNSPVIATLRSLVKPLSCDVIRYYLPDLLWGFSLSCGVLAILAPTGRLCILWAYTGFFCGVVWELLQSLHLVSGTGDLLDMAMYLLGSGICMLINLKRRE